MLFCFRHTSFSEQGNPLSRDDLQVVCLDKCKICAIMSAREQSRYSDEALIDREVLLCALNIKTMIFPKTEPQGNTYSNQNSNGAFSMIT